MIHTIYILSIFVLAMILFLGGVIVLAALTVLLEG